MNINLNISNIPKHVKINENKNLNNIKTKTYTKIKPICFSSINALNINNKIKNKIKYSCNYFITVFNFDYVNIKNINENFIENIEYSDKYIIFEFKKNNYIPFNYFFLNINCPKKFFFYLIDSFSYLLSSLLYLNDNSISFFDLSPENIQFSFDKPLIKNFQNSLNINKLDEKYIENIIKGNIDNFIFKPIEVHILFYLIKNNLFSISYNFIEEISEIFTNNLNIQQIFSESMKTTYKLNCINYLKKYINIPKLDIINSILKSSDKWDIYSLSLIYLRIISNFKKIFSLNNNFIDKFILELYENIQPEPYKRNTLNEFNKKINDFYNIDWNFVNNLSKEKMNLFKEELEKLI